MAKGGRKRRFATLRRLIRWSLYLLFLGPVLFLVFLTGVFLSLDEKDPFQIPDRAPGILIVAADGTKLVERGSFFGDEARLEKLPKHMIDAIVAIEDRRFWYHPGIDPIGLARAMWANLRAGRVVEGGSTLTQQLAKNLFLERKRTLWRKAQEAALALWLEWKLTKKEILSLYLNRVYFGAGAYGVEQAAKRYFNKPASRLTLGEAALLAGLVKAPSAYNPLKHRERALKRAKVVLAAMVDAGYISKKQAARAMRSIRFRPSDLGQSSSANYVADWIVGQLPKLIGKWDESILVETTIDRRVQGVAARVLRRTLAKVGRRRRIGQGAIVVMAPDGSLRAMVGGRRYTKNAFNRATRAKRQPGSAFKPFVYLTALEAGYTPVSVVVDEPVRIGDHVVRNHDNRYLGPVTLTTALAKSINTVAVKLALNLGPKRVIETAYRLGISSPLEPVPSIALGVSSVSPLELVSAYAPFANGGRLVSPWVVKRIVTRSGQVIYERKGSGLGRVVNPEHVGMMNYMLRAVVREGTGRKAFFRGQDIAGKTGTSQKFRDAWFVGYTGHLLGVVWLGNDDNRPMRGVGGGGWPAIIWRQVMAAAHKELPYRQLPGQYLPPPVDVNVAQAPRTLPPPRRPRPPRTLVDWLRSLFR